MNEIKEPQTEISRRERRLFATIILIASIIATAIFLIFPTVYARSGERDYTAAIALGMPGLIALVYLIILRPRRK